MERIHLTKDEKNVLRHVAEKGGEGPWELPMLQVKCALCLLEQKGLFYYILNFDEAVDARLTLCGRYYIEQNPKLKNPTLWGYIASSQKTRSVHSVFANPTFNNLPCSRYQNNSDMPIKLDENC